jgi:hypothetical protein
MRSSHFHDQDTCDFVIEDIHTEKIREMELHISECSRRKISEYDLWTKDDSKQEVQVYLRSLRHLVEGVLADLGFKSPVSLV